MTILVCCDFNASARTAPDSFANLAEKLLPAVVNISTTALAKKNSGKRPQLPQFPPGSPFEEFFKEFFDKNNPQQQRKSTSLGSGFIIAKSGIVITNNHVIKDADEIKVILQNNETLTAEVIGRDAKTDIAVLRIKPKKDLPFVKFGDSDKMRVGDWVVAIGNPFGLGGSVTAGIVSARGRNIGSGPYDDFIQTDASINRGNSGGPLFNMAGEVIGINTAIFSPSGGSIGIGFSIPSKTAKSVISQLVKYGKTRRGWLGVRIQKVTPEIAESLGLRKPVGALIASVTKSSPAAMGGIRAGDVILKFNNKSVKEMRNLPKIVAETEINMKVDVEIWRERRKMIMQVSVGELDERESIEKTKKPAEKIIKEKRLKISSIGISISRISDSTRQKYNLKANSKGVIIVDVDNGGVAAEKGIKVGDVIVEVSQSAVSRPNDVKKKIDSARSLGRKSVLFLVQAQEGLRFVALRITKK
jgi:serine protease Do